MLPKANGPRDVVQAGHYLSALEVVSGLAPGDPDIAGGDRDGRRAVPLGDYAAAKPERLYGLTWGAEDLSAAVGASGCRDASGEWTHTYRMVRSLCLLGACGGWRGGGHAARGFS